MRAFLLNRITRETVLQILEGRSQERGWGEESARMALNLLIDDGNAQARNRTEAVNDSLQVIDGFTADLRSIVGAYAEDERLVGWSSELARLQRNMV